MSRKERSEVQQRGAGELWGVLMVATALFLLLALFSYDRHDLAFNRVPANESIHNLIGRAGAQAAWAVFFVAGAGAYLIPVLLLAFGAAAFVPAFGYLRRTWRSWVGAAGLIIAGVGLLDLHGDQFTGVQRNLDSIGPGGWLGYVLNQQGTVYMFNRFGATILYSVMYLASLWLLTDLHFWEGLKAWWSAKLSTAREVPVPERRAPEPTEKIRRQPGPFAENPPITANPEVSSKGLGADLKPFPEPTFSDNSLPKVRGDTKSSDPFKKPSLHEAVPMGTTIPADEVKAAIAPASATSSESPASEKSSTGVERALAENAGGTSPIPSPSEGSGVGATSVNPSAGEGAPGQRGKLSARRSRPITVASTPIIGNYKLPSLDLLHFPDLSVKPTETKEELMAHSRLMVQTLAQFGIEVAPGDITRGPTITRYELHPAPGVKLERIASLTNNIAAALKAERINVLAPIPGKSSVGIEVPNTIKTKVIMRDLLESPEWVHSKARIPLALGKDVYGHPIIADLADMPHLLIAGSTGSGKSVCINAIAASLLYRFSPDQLRFVMIDPKVVELQQYNSLPHLVVPVVTDPKKVVLALRWVVNEMEKRYQIFAKVGVRNIRSFNERPKDRPPPAAQPELPLTTKKEKVEAGAEGFAVEVDEEIVVPRDEDIVIPEKLSYIVVIIDELADLMLVAPADVELAIARITQMARAAGIHCIVATQRPSVDVITGVIKANIPARLAFQVAAKVDSRTILDQMGADKLLGKGDMLYLPPGSARLTRAQGVLITDAEIESVVTHIARQGKPSYEVEIHQALQKAPGTMGQMSLDPDSGVSDEDELLIEKCIEVIRSEKKASVSLLQRRLKLGYGRASRLMDELEDRGIVGPSKGAEPRDILLDLDGEGYDGGGQQMV